MRLFNLTITIVSFCSGDTLSLQVTVHDPIGDRIYSEGPSSQVADDSGVHLSIYRYMHALRGLYR